MAWDFRKKSSEILKDFMIVDDTQFLVLKKRIFKAPLEIKIVSGSMEPLIKTGERIMVEKCEDPNIYDVVVYQANDKRLICHFVCGVSKAEPGFLLLQSLTSAPMDLPVSKDRVLGRVIGKKISFYYKMIFVLKRLFV